MKTQVAAATKPEVITYGISGEAAARFGLPCGGTLQLVLEPVSEKSGLPQLLETVGRQQLVKRRLEMASGRASLESGRWSDVLEFDPATSRWATLAGIPAPRQSPIAKLVGTRLVITTGGRNGPHATTWIATH